MAIASWKRPTSLGRYYGANRHTADKASVTASYAKLVPDFALKSFGRLRPSNPIGGCCFNENWARDASIARVFWDARLDPGVIRAAASPTDYADPEAFNIVELKANATLLLSEGLSEEVRLYRSGCSIRLSIEAGTLLRGPVRLAYRLSGHTDLEARLRPFQRLAAFLLRDMLVPTATAGSLRPEKMRLILATLDALAAGASYRDIAIRLYGKTAVASDWNEGSDYLKSRVRRLVGACRQVMEDGPLTLLNTPAER